MGPGLKQVEKSCARKQSGVKCINYCYAAVTVIQNATVLELKKAIQRHFVLRQERQNGTKHISW